MAKVLKQLRGTILALRIFLVLISLGIYGCAPEAPEGSGDVEIPEPDGRLDYPN